MQLGEFCMKVGQFCPSFSNYEEFIDELFTAAGTKPYISDSYKRKLYTGAKVFNEKLKGSLGIRGKNNVSGLKKFFSENIPDDNVPNVLIEFGVPEKEAPDKSALCTALALQMIAIIDGDEGGGADVVVTAYQENKKAKEEESPEVFRTTYPGDSVFVASKSHHEIDVHGTVTHTWELHNTGKVEWENRKLVYIRGPKDRPEANPAEVLIPDIGPGESTKITTTFDGRGFEAVTHCIWEMQDEDGDNCFPNQRLKFSVTIDAKFMCS